MSTWLYVRLGIIFLVLVAGIFVPLGAQAKPPIDWLALLFILSATPFMLVFVIGIQTINSRSAKIWRRPSWLINPFSFSEPLQFFHLAAWVCLAQGVVGSIRYAISAASFELEALVPIAMGIGVWLGVQLSMVLFKRKMAPNNSYMDDDLQPRP